MSDKPKGELTTRTLAMPSDTNPAGDIFGGWLLAQMDIAGNLVSKRIAKGRTVTIAVDSMNFHLPVFVGDTVACYTKIKKIGRTSITIHVEAWVTRQYTTKLIRVTEGNFTFVAVDDDRNPRVIEKDNDDD
jgi:acyl-CoA thioesterase YciA